MSTQSPHPGLLPRAVTRFQCMLKKEVKKRHFEPRRYQNRQSKIILFEDVTAKVFMIVHVCVHLARFNWAMFKCITVKHNGHNIVFEECKEFDAKRLTQRACSEFKQLCEVNLTLWPHNCLRPFRTMYSLRHTVQFASLQPLCTWCRVGFTRKDKRSLQMLLKPSEVYTKEMQLAFVMASHPRLGSGSWIRILSTDNIRSVFDRLTTIANVCPVGEYLLCTEMPRERGMKTLMSRCSVRIQQAMQAPELEAERYGTRRSKRHRERNLKSSTFLHWKNAITHV